MYAAREGAIDAARALVELGADPESRRAAADHRRRARPTRSRRGIDKHIGTTALVYAIINAHFDLAAMLLEHGADPNIADHTRHGGAVRRGRVEHAAVGAEPAGADLARQAGRRGGSSTVLLEHGADPNARLKLRAAEDFPRSGRHAEFRRGRDAADARGADQRCRGHAPADRVRAPTRDATLPDGTTVLMIAAGQGLGRPGATARASACRPRRAPSQRSRCCSTAACRSTRRTRPATPRCTARCRAATRRQAAADARRDVS